MSIRKNDEIVAIDPFDPSRKIVRKVAALTDEYVKLYNGSFVYNAKVEDGCFFVTDEENGGMVITLYRYDYLVVKLIPKKIFFVDAFHRAHSWEGGVLLET